MSDDERTEGDDASSAEQGAGEAPGENASDEIIEAVPSSVTTRRRATPFADRAEIFGPALRAIVDLLPEVPAFVEVLEALRPKTEYVADIPAQIMKMLDEGLLHVSVDKDGRLLASVRNAKEQIEHNMRLEKVKVTPELGHAIVNLQQQMTMGQILSEVHETQLAIGSMRAELRDDRLAIADSAWEQGQQALAITDATTRTAKLIEAQSRATDARAALARFVSSAQVEFDEHKNRGGFHRLVNSYMHTKAAEQITNIFSALEGVMKALQVEVNIYLVLDETEAARTCIEQFAKFLNATGLADHEVLRELHSYGAEDQSQLIDAFRSMATSMDALTSGSEDDQAEIEPDTPEDDDEG